MQMQVVEALHQARSERRLEVNMVQCYGDLTRMDTDAPDNGENDAFSKSGICMIENKNMENNNLSYFVLRHSLHSNFL